MSKSESRADRKMIGSVADSARSSRAEREAAVDVVAEADVDEREVGQPRAERGQRVRAVRIGRDLVAVPAQRVRVVGADGGLVLDDGDAALMAAAGLYRNVTVCGAANWASDAHASAALMPSRFATLCSLAALPALPSPHRRPAAIAPCAREMRSIEGVSPAGALRCRANGPQPPASRYEPSAARHAMADGEQDQRQRSSAARMARAWHGSSLEASWRGLVVSLVLALAVFIVTTPAHAAAPRRTTAGHAAT